MAFHDDLVEVARQLARLPGAGSNQACLRRSVSTAYYALFHLLISDATANWSRPQFRAKLARCFDHGPMKTASDAKAAEIEALFKDHSQDSSDAELILQLWTVASTFSVVQEMRIIADYNLAVEWNLHKVGALVAQVTDAFSSWNAIRNTDPAQEYLVSLLGFKDRRSGEPRPPRARPQAKQRSSD